MREEKSYPDIPVLRKIEEVYGVSYEQLIFYLWITIKP